MSTQEVVTLAELKAFVPRTDTADDALLTVILNSVIAQVVKHLGCPIIETQITDEAHTPEKNQCRVFTNNLPVNALTVKESGAVLVEDTDYGVDLPTGTITRLHSYWINDHKAVKLTYKAGWAGSAVPEEIKFAVKQQAKFLFLRGDEIGLTGKTMEGTITLTEGHQLLKGVRELLAPYRMRGAR